MRKASIALVVLLLLVPCIGQQTGNPGPAGNGGTVTIAGCVLNANGTFRLITRTHTYILKGLWATPTDPVLDSVHH